MFHLHLEPNGLFESRVDKLLQSLARAVCAEHLEIASRWQQYLFWRCLASYTNYSPTTRQYVEQMRKKNDLESDWVVIEICNSSTPQCNTFNVWRQLTCGVLFWNLSPLDPTKQYLHSGPYKTLHSTSFSMNKPSRAMFNIKFINEQTNILRRWPSSPYTKPTNQYNGWRIVPGTSQHRGMLGFHPCRWLNKPTVDDWITFQIGIMTAQ